MAKFDLKFLSEESNLWWCKVTSCQELNNILITTHSEDDQEITVALDKSTAIKFAKTLRTEINKITEQEGGLNG